MSTKRSLPPLPPDGGFQDSGIYAQPHGAPSLSTSLLELPVIDGCAVLVSQLPEHCSNEDLELFFESPRFFGKEIELVVKEVQQDNATHEAVVTFESISHATHVLNTQAKQPLVFKKTTIKVSPYVPRQSTIEEVTEPEMEAEEARTVEGSDDYAAIGGLGATIEVTGFDDEVTDDTLRYYFENQRRSGGGDIVNMTVNREEEFAHITFKDSSVVPNVLKKKHKVLEQDLVVKPFVFSKTDLLFCALPEDVCQETLQNFIEAKTGWNVVVITFNVEKTKAIVQFDACIDLVKAATLFKKHTIKDVHIQPNCVSVSYSIIVYDLPDGVTEDAVKYYFENKKRSGGGDVETVDLHTGELYCIVNFKESSVVAKVCTKEDHKINGTPVKVSPFNRYLGLPFGCDIAGDQSSDSLTVNFDDTFDHYKVQLVCSNDTQRGAFRDKMAEHHADVDWSVKPPLITCTVTKETPGYGKLKKQWTETVRKAVSTFLDGYKVGTVDVEEENWDETMGELRNISMEKPENIAIKLEKTNRKIVIICVASDYSKTDKEVEKVAKKAADAVKQKKERTTKDVKLLPFKVKYLKAANYFEGVQNDEFPFTVEIDESRGLIKITGSKATVSECVLAMYNFLDELCMKEITVEKEQAELLQKKKVQRYIGQKLERKNLIDTWEVEDCQVKLVAASDQDCNKMDEVLTNVLVDTSMQLDDALDKLIKSDKWRNAEKELRAKIEDCLVISVDRVGKKLIAFTIDKHESEVSDFLDEFREKNSIFKDKMTVEPPIAEYMEEKMLKTVCAEIDQVRDKGFLIKWNIDKKGIITLEGNTEAVKEAKKVFNALTKKICSAVCTIKQRKIQRYFLTQKGKECITKVQTMVSCVIDVMGSGFNKTMIGGKFTAQQTLHDVKTYAEVTIAGKVKLSVVGGDITEVDVDVIVNAANRELKHLGGLAAVIQRKGGRELQKDSEDRIKSKGKLGDGDVYIGKSGNLKCKAVAHAVGPHWQGGTKGEDKVLKDTVKKCLHKTEKKGYHSIAIPALSAGMFSYPVDLSCQDIITAIHDYAQKGCTVTKIVLCDISQTTVKAFMDALRGVFPTTKVLEEISVGAGMHEKGPSWISDAEDSRPRRRHGGGGASARTGGATGNIKVEIVKAELAQEKTDVVVNSCSNDLKLERGILSKSILRAAGDSLQQELDNNFPNGIQPGEIAATAGGRMKCKQIYHIAVKQYSKGGSIQSVEDIVYSCLEEAHDSRHSSISFPAIGTGGQKYPKSDVARAMFGAVRTFARKQPKSKLTSVRFIVFYKDTETYTAFARAEGGGGSGGDSASGSDSDDEAASHSSRGGAGGGGYRGDAADLTVGPFRVKVTKGDITEHMSDAIVASSNKDLDLSKGKGMKNEGLAIVSAGKLPAKWVMFVDTKYNTHEWEKVVFNCLKTAEKHRLTSIAFPALGTAVKCEPEDIAGVMRSAMNDFMKSNPKHLSEVHIVVFQGSMVPKFKKGIQGSGSVRTSGGGGGKSHSPRDHKPSRSQADGDEDVFRFTVYTENKQDIERAKKSLEKTASQEWQEKVINDPQIQKLSRWHVNALEKFATNNHVEIAMKPDQECIELVGLAINVADVSNKVQEMLRDVEKSRYNHENAQLLASVVKWMFLKDQKTIAFSKKENMLIERAYKNKDSDVTLKTGSAEYKVDLVNMEEWDVTSPGKKFKVIRRDMIQDVGLETPKTWSKMSASETVKLVTLSSTDPEYNLALGDLQKTLGRAPSIQKIERIQNPTLYTQYVAKKKQMDSKNGKKKNELMLWHGTADYAVPSINAHGFNRSYCGKNATAIGQGVYFATNAAYSDQPTYTPADSKGLKRMYRCLVLVGETTQGNSSMRTPPPKDKNNPHILYDSVSNPPTCSMYVIFNDTQAYPAHLITYK